MKLGVNEGISNTDYHAEQNYLSSSNLKTLLKDPAKFHREKILGIREPEQERPYLTEGSYFHSLVLEPEKIAEEYAIYDGFRKQGKEYEAFLLENPGRIVLSRPQVARCQRYLDGYKRRPEAGQLLSGGVPELTLCSELLKVPVKMRADYINVEKSYIADVKTTQYESGPEAFKLAMEEYKYGLSAALYAQIAHDVYGKLFDFYFVVLSKADFECNIYRASTETLSAGAAEVTRALVKYKKCLKTNNWTDSLVSAKLEQIGDYEIEEV